MLPAFMMALSSSICRFRRIAALLLLEPALDENYDSVKQNAFDWPASA
jgi:hypothetical protein